MRRRLVQVLEYACTWTHPITERRPWLWIGPPHPLTMLAVRLDDRWGTGVFRPAQPTLEIIDEVDR